MRRRDFFKAIGGAAALWPVTADAQRRRPLVGWLQTQPVTTAARFVSAFLQGMADHGYVEGRDVDFERRYAGGDLQRLPALASELVALKPTSC
jgi:putative ABC transport system substrate-binding protein